VGAGHHSGGAGIPYVVKVPSIAQSHLRQRDRCRFLLQGPDGSRVLLRWDAIPTRTSGRLCRGLPLWASSTDQERVGFIEDTVRARCSPVTR
jgi:hypothetical protein